MIKSNSSDGKPPGKLELHHAIIQIILIVLSIATLVAFYYMIIF